MYTCLCVCICMYVRTYVCIIRMHKCMCEMSYLNKLEPPFL